MSRLTTTLRSPPAGGWLLAVIWMASVGPRSNALGAGDTNGHERKTAASATPINQAAVADCERWGIFEVVLDGPEIDNPFVDVQLAATFEGGGEKLHVAGFYDGDGVYRIRCMPGSLGAWRYRTHSNVAALEGKTGEFRVVAPSAGNHGPVRVFNTFHFAYADGRAYKPVGTTCYAWTSQGDELERQTLKTLATAPFNKIRMCVFPKRYAWNENEPPLYPFEGTPPNRWDFTRFNPAYFRHLEERILDLQKLGIEADLILFHPYDGGHWGFDRMPDGDDDRYLRYLVARLAAFRNVWWSLANEYDFLTQKQEADWDRFFQIVRATDPYGHLRSVHNGRTLYNHAQAWVTHASIQNGSAAEEAGRAVLYRDAYRKPVVLDEIKYEGDIPKRWGNISAEELVHRFWECTIAGVYATHGECYLHPQDVLWWSKGGRLHGQSPQRLEFLREVLAGSPPGGIDPIDKWQDSRIAGKAGEYYLVYFGHERPETWPFRLPRYELNDGMKFRVEVLDTWNMTVSPVEQPFTVRRQSEYLFADEAGRAVGLPSRPGIALRIARQE